MSEIVERVLNILKKLEKQVKTSKEVMETYKDRNIEESAQVRIHWMKDVMDEYSSLNKIVRELLESLAYWATEQLEKRQS